MSDDEGGCSGAQGPQYTERPRYSEPNSGSPGAATRGSGATAPLLGGAAMIVAGGAVLFWPRDGQPWHTNLMAIVCAGVLIVFGALTLVVTTLKLLWATLVSGRRRR